MWYTDAMIEVQVNGEARQVAEGTTVSGLLHSMGVDPRRVAVEVNAEVVTKAAHSTTPLCAGDQIEVVTFVGGG